MTQSNSTENKMGIAQMTTLYTHWTHFPLNHEVNIFLSMLIYYHFCLQEHLYKTLNHSNNLPFQQPNQGAKYQVWMTLTSHSCPQLLMLCEQKGKKWGMSRASITLESFCINHFTILNAKCLKSSHKGVYTPSPLQPVSLWHIKQEEAQYKSTWNVHVKSDNI